MSVTKMYSEVKKGYTSFIDGDIIFAKITPCMENGKVAVVNNLKNGLGFGSTEFHVIRLLNQEIEKKFIFFILFERNLEEMRLCQKVPYCFKSSKSDLKHLFYKKILLKYLLMKKTNIIDVKVN